MTIASTPRSFSLPAYENAAAKAAASGIRHVVLKPHIEESLVAHVQDALREAGAA